jgi:hypothetical protein
MALSASAQTIESRLSDLQSAVQTQVRSVAFDASRLTPGGVASGLRPRTPENAVYFVRDLIEYDIYSGRVRGERGTLFTRAANSLDRSMLLGALLNEMNVEWRIATGRLSNEQAARLVTLATRGGRYDSSLIPEGAVIFNATSDVRHRNIAQSHFWVQAEIDGEWVDFDTSDPALEPGQAMVEASETFAPTAIPEPEVQTTHIGLYYTTSGTNGGEVLTIEQPTASLAFRNINISIIRQQDGSFMPRATIGTDTFDGSRLYAGGLNRVWIEIFFRQGGLESRIVRDLYNADSQFDTFNVDQAVYSLLLLPGFVGPDYFRAVVSTVWDDFAGSIARLEPLLVQESTAIASGAASDTLTNELTDLLGTITGVSALTFAHLSDELTLRLGLLLGVRPFYDRPRVIIAQAVRDGERVFYSLDLRDNTIDALPYDNVPWAATYALQAIRGRVDSELEGQVLEQLTGTPILDTPEFMALARSEGSSLRTVHPGNAARLRDSAYSAEAQRRMNTEVTNAGHIVLAPSAPVTIGTDAFTFWWRIEPSTAAVLGVAEVGLHPAFSHLTGVVSGENPAAPSAANLIQTVLASLQAAATTSFAAARDTDSFERLVCTAGCDLMDTTFAVCGGGRPAFDVILDSCLTRQATISIGSLTGQSVTCSSQVQNFLCGVELFDAVASRLITVDSSSGYLGPWSELSPVYMGACDCATR